MDHPVYPAVVGTPDADGNVSVTIGDNPPVILSWRGSAMEAVNEALDLLESQPRVAVESCYPFVAIEDVLSELTPEDRR